jgi:phosphate acetyltransferase
MHPALISECSEYLFARRGDKDIATLAEARAKLLHNPLYLGNCLVGLGYAHGQVGGSLSPTPDVVRSALHCIGTAAGIKTASSFMLMTSESTNRCFVFSDCGFVIDPSSEQLADIAAAAAENFDKLTGDKPRVAMLSFSTKGSATHSLVDRVREATQIVRARNPEISVDGEMQFDAAFVPEVGERKAPGSDVAGQANVFVFPNLAAGNIGYKIAERLGGFKAAGPILQGLHKPSNDLSRGCSASDIVDAIVITALQGSSRSGENKNIEPFLAEL